jgi:two-component system response regulator HydG
VSIVDDELDTVCLFLDALRDIPGISIFAFTDPALALEHFKINKSVYVMLLSDYKMLGMDGIQLIKQVKDLNDSVPTILMTAYAINDKLFQEYAAKNIINGFLRKLVRLEDLREEVNAQLHYHQISIITK